jgi:RNA polymerase sigma factor (sigma-70 family)
MVGALLLGSIHSSRRVEITVNAVAKEWRLTREGFDRFLLGLDPDRDKAGRSYELLRAKLVNYFDWRDCPFPEDHADDALNRVIRKIDAGETIQDPSTYVFGIARMMLREIARSREKERATLSRLPAMEEIDMESDEAERRIECLRECLSALRESERELISQYYEGDGSEKIKSRKELAARLGLPPNALRIRACRLRERLEECMTRRLGGSRF